MKHIAFYFLLTLCLISCDDDDEVVSPAQQLQIDTDIIDNYIDSNGISDVIIDVSGLRYTIEESGDGLIASSTSRVTVKYEGRFLSNNQVFDNNETGATFFLSQLILGWQIGIPKIQEGGKITLYIPSGLAYGPNGNSAIPGNSVLIFEIELLSVT